MENEIPFPFLSGQYIKYNDEYYQIKGQGKFINAKYDYFLPPTVKQSGLSINAGNTNLFATNGLYEWATWIDSEDLEVEWTVENRLMNTLRSFSFPLTFIQAPYGSNGFPLFDIKDAAGNITFALTNKSAVKAIAGTLQVMLYSYQIEKVSKPDVYTDINYSDDKNGGVS
jgi:hypothetical protein